MANKKISELLTATQFNDDDYTIIVQSNTTKKIAKENMYRNYMFSANEKEIGKWIDDKPIYRKVITVNNLTPDTIDTKTILHNISNLDTLVGLKCMAYNGDTWFDFNNYTWYNEGESTINSTLHTFVGDTSIYVVYQGPHYLYAIESAYFVLEYTKTTD